MVCIAIKDPGIKIIPLLVPQWGNSLLRLLLNLFLVTVLAQQRLNALNANLTAGEQTESALAALKNSFLPNCCVCG